MQETLSENLEFREYRGVNPLNLAQRNRRAMFLAACKYLGVEKTEVTSGFGIGFRSFMNSDYVELTGDILDKVKRDPAIVANTNRIVNIIKSNSKYRVKLIDVRESFETQLGGQRSRVEMWKQALGFWHWTGQYSSTWDAAFNELTWTVRTTVATCHYIAQVSGKISLNFSFADTLNLRPDWANKSLDYNAICVVLGFIYHDMLFCSDKMQVRAKWQTIVQG